MKYIRKSDRQYPFSEIEIRSMYPDTSFGYPFVPPSEFAEVVAKEPPIFDQYSQILIEKAPKLYRGVYSQQWEVIDLDQRTVQENAIKRIDALRDSYMSAVQMYIDSEAKKKGYDSILSACSYANSTIPKFKTEGKAALLWRDQIWDYCSVSFQEIQEGNRALPKDIQSFIEELPKINW